MLRKLFKALLVRGTEAIVAVALTLVFFLIFTRILSLSFPRGTSLHDLVRLRESAGSSVHHAIVELRTATGEASRRPFIAELSNVRRNVKSKAADEIAWRSARSGTPLMDRHAVQTFARSGATISFDARNRLLLAENSLVVVKRLDGREDLREKRAALVVLDGELRGRLSSSEQEAMEVQLVLGSGSARILSQDGERAEFRVTVNQEESATLSVYEGAAEVSAGGKSVVVMPNHSVTLVQAGQPGPAKVLPGPPALSSPPDGFVGSYRSVPPRIRFRWRGRGGTESYRLVIASDPEFREVVHEEQLPGESFRHGNLSPGSYYWRVSGLIGPVEGTASEARRLRIERDRELPALRVAFPDRVVGTERLLLRGATEPGAQVFIRGEQVPVMDAGQFEYALLLQRGLNVVVVEAVDAAGNVAYQSRVVRAKY